MMMSCDHIAENETHPFGVYSPCSTSSNYDSFKNYYNDNGKKPGALFAFRLGLMTESIEMDQIPKTIGDIKGIKLYPGGGSTPSFEDSIFPSKNKPDEVEFWKEKYVVLLEKYNDLLSKR